MHCRNLRARQMKDAFTATLTLSGTRPRDHGPMQYRSCLAAQPRVGPQVVFSYSNDWLLHDVLNTRQQIKLMICS